MNKQNTVGEQRVRITFNPSENKVVDLIKQKTAELIDLAEELKSKDGRLASLAQTSYEEAAMTVTASIVIWKKALPVLLVNVGLRLLKT